MIFKFLALVSGLRVLPVMKRMRRRFMGKIMLSLEHTELKILMDFEKEMSSKTVENSNL